MAAYDETSIREDSGDEVFPVALEGIGVWPTFKAPEGKGQFFIGQIEEDVYLTVPESKVPTMMAILGLCDGDHSAADISREMRDSFKLDIPVQAVIDLLARTGLLVHPRPEKLDRGEFRDFSNTLVTISVAKYLNKLAPLVRKLAIPMAVTILFTILAAAFSMFVFPGLDLEIVRDAKLASRLDSIVFMFLLILPVSILLHELGHTTAATFFGLKASHAELTLYMKFMLMIIFKIKGVYTLKPYQRIIVWCAGVFVNLGISSSCLLVAIWLDPSDYVRSILYKAAWFNLVVILANISPFFPTDLYFVMSTVIKRVNMRTSAYMVLKNKFRGAQTKSDWVLVGYTIFALTSLIWAIFITAIFLFGIMMNFGLSPLIAAAVLVCFVYLMFTLRVKVFKRRIQRHTGLTNS